MNRQVYSDKTMQFCNDSNTSKLQKEPTTKIEALTRKELKKVSSIFTAKQCKDIILINPAAPQLRARRKTRKDGWPMRQIVNYINSPGYEISSELNDILCNNYVFGHQCIVRNTYEIVEKIHHIDIPATAIWVSLHTN